MKILLERVHANDKQTIGRFFLLTDFDHVKYVFDSLELPDKNNQPRVSRIPAGTYTALVHQSPKHGWSLWLQGVEGRSEILVHKGNFYYDILGCILIGLNLKDINSDGYKDVIESKRGINRLKGYLKGISEIEITIVDETEFN